MWNLLVCLGLTPHAPSFHGFLLLVSSSCWFGTASRIGAKISPVPDRLLCENSVCLFVVVVELIMAGGNKEEKMRGMFYSRTWLVWAVRYLGGKVIFIPCYKSSEFCVG